MKLSRLLVIALGALLALAVFTAAAQNKASRMTGEIVVVEGNTMRIKTVSGQMTPITLTDNVRISKRTPMRLKDIKPGAFLGTTAAPSDDGTLVASEVHVFPEALRGTGEGHRPFGDDGRSTMTNATVTDVKPVSTGNAKLGPVKGAKGELRVTLTYKGGEKTVVIPANTPVVLSEVGSRADLKPREHVIVTVTAAPDGSLQTERVSVGVKGSVPPI